MRLFIAAAVLLSAALLISPDAAAHRLNIFVTQTADRLEGQVYFHGGTPLGGAIVALQDTSGATLLTVTADADGRFSLTPPDLPKVTLVARDSAGHRSVLNIDLDSGLEPVPEVVSAQVPPQIDRADFETMVEDIVASHVARLESRMIEQQAETRWQDVIGGVGYIAGLFGLLYGLWCRSKMRAHSGIKT